MDEYTLLQENGIDRIYIRSWKPGDGLNCSHAKAAPRGLPCGRPVAVAVSEDARPCGRPDCTRKSCRCEPRRTRRVVCLNHLPTLKRPHSLVQEAQRIAHERLAAAHWDEWQTFVKEEIERATAAQFNFADPEIHRIVLGETGGEA